MMKTMRCLIAILLFLGSATLWAEESAFPGLVVTEAPINRADIESIKRGAKFFSTNCMSCHTLVYLRYNKLAAEAGITLAKMPINVKNWPYGVTPPDLSLETEIRGPDWIYTYLHSFYKDTTRPTGSNNLMLPNTAMPNILAPYQGEQVLTTHKQSPGILYGDLQYYSYLELTKQGSMTPEQYDAAITDVVNFLAYAAEPYYLEQHRIGWWVLGFLALLFPLMLMLKREYWKDVKRRK
ncbi:MAG: cytochrome c1 [Gammaproteobacteria bacterium]|nr:cytochrome c1 [Gammaproteobacteria bacterium]